MSSPQWARVLARCSAAVEEHWPKLPDAPTPSPQGLAGGFLFSGTAHEAVPRQLLLDTRLTPLERNAWQVFRLLLDKEGLAVPRYEDLQPYLATVPYGKRAARETVARVLTMLRLTRWLSLVIRGRDQASGRIQGSLYVLHDDPVTPAEAMELDEEYLALVGSCQSHPNKAVRLVAQGALAEIAEDGFIDQRRLPTRLDSFGQRWARQGLERDALPEVNPGLTPSPDSERWPNSPVRNADSPGSESELGRKALVRNVERPSSDSEPSLKSSTCRPVRNPNATSTVRTDTSTCIKTVPRAREGSNYALRWPQSLRLTPGERQAAAQSLDKLRVDQRQAVLDEAGARCATGGVRNPCRYLMGLVQRALRDDFTPWAAPIASQESPPAASPPSMDMQAPYVRNPNEPLSEQVMGCLQELRQLTRNASKPSG